MYMNIIALGTGSAFTMDGRQTNFAVHRNGKLLLIDCGGDIRHSLKDVLGVGAEAIDSVYISHAHADHVGGLEWLGFMTYFNPSLDKPKMFADRQLMLDLWEHSLRGGMEGIEGQDAKLETFFDLHPVDRRDGKFEWEGIHFQLVQSVHVSAGYRLVESFGLMIKDPNDGTSVFLTTDVQFAPETSLKAYYREADLIIHDCETGAFKTGVHAHYDQLTTLPAELKSKMMLTHYGDNVFKEWDAWCVKAREDGFFALAQPGVLYRTGAIRETPITIENGLSITEDEAADVLYISYVLTGPPTNYMGHEEDSECVLHFIDDRVVGLTLIGYQELTLAEWLGHPARPSLGDPLDFAVRSRIAK